MLSAAFTTLLVVTFAFGPCAPAYGQSSAPSPEAIRSAPPGQAATNVVAFSPDGSRIAAVNTANVITIRDVDTGTLTTTLPGQDGYMSTVDWSPDGALLASGSNDGTIQIWDVAAETKRRTLTGFDALDRAFGGATDVAFSPDGRYLAGVQGAPSGRIIAWRVADGREVLRVDRPRKVGGLAWGPAGDTLYAVERDGALYTWSVPGGKQLARRDLDDEQLTDLDRAGRYLAAGGEGGTVFVVDTRRDSVVRRFDPGDFVTRTAVVPDAGIVASAGGDGFLRVWDIDTGEQVAAQFAHDSIAYYVTASPDGQVLATVGQDNYIRLWTPTTGALIRAISGR
jgi:WD40 repeat protein